MHKENGGDVLIIRKIDLESAQEVESVKSFLKEQHGLGFDSDTEATFIIEEHGEIMATASYAGQVIKQVAMSEKWKGTGRGHLVIEQVIKELVSRDRTHLFVYTQPKSVALFMGMGFAVVAKVPGKVALLEWGTWTIRDEKKRLAAFRETPSQSAGAIVMNANPFTKGHRYLIEQAAACVDGLYVFVVESDRSTFPYPVRFGLIEQGTEDLRNVRVLPGGPYIISGATFPAYFTQQEDQVRLQSELDAEIFGKHIAAALGISQRYVGTEPICDVTRQYNEALKKVLPRHGIAVNVLERLALDDGVVSATQVRQAILEKNWAEIGRLVPETTFAYLKSDEGSALINGIRRRSSRH